MSAIHVTENEETKRVPTNEAQAAMLACLLDKDVSFRYTAFAKTAELFLNRKLVLVLFGTGWPSFNNILQLVNVLTNWDPPSHIAQGRWINQRADMLELFGWEGDVPHETNVDVVNTTLTWILQRGATWVQIPEKLLEYSYGEVRSALAFAIAADQKKEQSFEDALDALLA